MTQRDDICSNIPVPIKADEEEDEEKEKRTNKKRKTIKAAHRPTSYWEGHTIVVPIVTDEDSHGNSSSSEEADSDDCRSIGEADFVSSQTTQKDIAAAEDENTLPPSPVLVVGYWDLDDIDRLCSQEGCTATGTRTCKACRRQLCNYCVTRGCDVCMETLADFVYKGNF